MNETDFSDFCVTVCVTEVIFMIERNNIKFSETTAGSYSFLWNYAERGYFLANENTHNLVNGQTIEGKLIEAKTKRALHILTCAHSPWLVPQRIDEKGTHVENNYSPLSNPTLHREFTSLNDDESILAFANKYGLLQSPTVALSPVETGGMVVLGEPVNMWREEIRIMGGLMALWDTITNQHHVGKLGWVVRWTSSTTVLLDGFAQYDKTQGGWQITREPINNFDGHHPLIRLDAILASSTYNADLIKQWKLSDVVEPAKLHVLREVNRHLLGHVSPQMLIPRDPERLPHDMYLFPDSLLAALWTLFLMELIGKIRPHLCDFCGNWGVMIKNRDSFYCSDRCRQAAFRKKRSLSRSAK